MPYNFIELKKKTEEIKVWFANELSHIRTGRATPSILDGVRVESYGARVPLNHVANITVSDAKTILVAPWDKNQIKAIETAIMEAGLGIGISSSGDGVRVVFPELTSETREMLLKLIKTKHEEARVSLRSARDSVWDDIQQQEKNGALSEDEKFRHKNEMQKIIDDMNATLDEMTERKAKEISV